jgi:hypothetical protein
MNKHSAALKELLGKINTLNEKISTVEQPALIDLHLLCDYTRQYYDVLIAMNAIAGATHVTNTSVFEIKQVAIEKPVEETKPEIIKPVENAGSKVLPPIGGEDLGGATVAIKEKNISINTNRNQTTEKTIAQPSMEKFKDYTSVGDGFEERKTVRDNFSNEQPAQAVADKLKITPLADLNDAIGINERFAYANVFMNGDINTFYSALAQLNSKQNFEEAYRHFKENVVEKYNVDKNNRLYREFVELLQRRFLK